jgi:hypothetical protein
MAKTLVKNVNEACKEVLALQAKADRIKDANKAVFDAIKAIDKEVFTLRGFLKTYKDGESFSTEDFVVSITSNYVEAFNRITVKVAEKV